MLRLMKQLRLSILPKDTNIQALRGAKPWAPQSPDLDHMRFQTFISFQVMPNMIFTICVAIAIFKLLHADQLFRDSLSGDFHAVKFKNKMVAVLYYYNTRVLWKDHNLQYTTSLLHTYLLIGCEVSSGIAICRQEPLEIKILLPSHSAPNTYTKQAKCND